MRTFSRIFRFGIVGLLVFTVFGSPIWLEKEFKVEGSLFGRPCHALVDHELAQLMLTKPNSPEVSKLFDDYRNQPLSTRTLAEISLKYSMDVSTLYFLQRTYQKRENQKAQDSYLDNFDAVTNSKFENQISLLRSFYVVFVPGMDYLDTSNGGDFARQRRLFSANGIKNELVLTDPWGLTDKNAGLVAQRLLVLSKLHSKILLVSASKGGLECAIVLGKILKPYQTSSIKAWVSVGGILSGSPVADTYLQWPRCWLAEIALMTIGQKINLISDLSYRKRAAELHEFVFPENVKRIHFVGAPLSRQIHKRIKRNYLSIKEYGPNDGITPLADELTADGIVVSELGFDHYYKHPEIDFKTFSLALTVVNLNN